MRDTMTWYRLLQVILIFINVPFLFMLPKYGWFNLGAIIIISLMWSYTELFISEKRGV